jgi:hypothetical protein
MGEMQRNIAHRRGEKFMQNFEWNTWREEITYEVKAYLKDNFKMVFKEAGCEKIGFIWPRIE